MPYAKRRCTGSPICPATLTSSVRYCPEHLGLIEQHRGSAAARGYGRKHKLERASWKPLVEAGTVRCRRCSELIESDEPWDLGHPDATSDAPTGPEHRGQCNRAAGARAALRSRGQTHPHDPFGN